MAMRRSARSSERVYPRVYGGTNGVSASTCSAGGLSPRVRGNHARPPFAFPYTGLSPRVRGNRNLINGRISNGQVYPRVYGGTRLPGPACLRRGEVYPRVYGGTAERVAGTRITAGLSPRVRGNPRRQYAPRRNLVKVYPRVYGGTDLDVRNSFIYGLSPRVRGNHRQAAQDYERPRGLSPRVRGNLPLLDVDRQSMGSIPACTGEPIWGPWAPPVMGSIPACTGEPRQPPRRLSRFTVYPRVYGGT